MCCCLKISLNHDSEWGQIGRRVKSITFEELKNINISSWQYLRSSNIATYQVDNIWGGQIGRRVKSTTFEEPPFCSAKSSCSFLYLQCFSSTWINQFHLECKMINDLAKEINTDQLALVPSGRGNKGSSKVLSPPLSTFKLKMRGDIHKKRMGREE